MTRTQLLSALFSVLCNIGCAASLDPNPSERCGDAVSCSLGRVCDRGFCVDRTLPDLGTSPPDAGPPLPPCARSNETRCGLSCVKLEDDLLHCGACDHACSGGERCRHSLCESD